MPERIQRRRTKGWRMPAGTVYVGRGSRWGNPFRVGAPHPLTGLTMDVATCTDLFRRGLEAAAAVGAPESLFADGQADLWRAWEAVAPHLTAFAVETALGDLRGRDLACWCPPGSPCHADVLLEIANRSA